MGTLVFQATLGGAVNIIGPNIANTINFTLPSADGTSGQTWTTNGSGVLAFGTLGIAGGGTGQITATAAFNALAPSQSGQSGKYLTTDGTNTSWATNPLGTVTSVAATVPSFLSIAGSPITTSGTLAFSLSGTALPTTSGGTGLTSFTSGGVVYASSTSALATGSALTFDGTNLGAGGASSPSAPVDIQANSGGTAIRIRGRASANAGALRFFANDNTTQRARFESNDTSFEINSIANLPITFLTNDTEAMRLTSTSLYTASGINVGIGLSNPAYSLDINSASARINIAPSTTTNGANVRMANSGGTAVVGLDANSSPLVSQYALNVFHSGAYPIIFSTSATERMRLDSAGNLGLGVTPSAWNAFVGSQIGPLGGMSLGGSIDDNFVGSNVYYNSGFKFARPTTATYATMYRQTNGVHSWQVSSATGTAGNPISFTQALTLHASGGLSLGNTTDPGTGKFTATQISTATGTVNAASGTATTMFTLSADGMYLVYDYLVSVGNATNTSFATVIVNNGAARIVANDGTQLTTLSGLDVQVTQVTGVTRTVAWSYTKVG